LALITSACSSTPKPYVPKPSKKIESVNFSGKAGDTLVAEPLTTIGDNYRPVFSPDGKKLLFLSENREEHKHLQVYELDLASRVERRVTFHDGDVQSAIYANDGTHVYYASSTDEIKEDPYFVKNLMRRVERSTEETQVSRIPGTLEELEPGPFEIYASALDGSYIRRLTRSSGFDGDLSLATKSHQIIFTSSRNKQRDIYLLNVSDGNIRRVTNDPFREVSPSVSQDGQSIVWSRLSEGLTAAQLFIADGRTMKATPMTSGNFFDVSPAWHPNSQEIVFASDRGAVGPNQQKNFDLYEVNKSGACLKRLTESPKDELFPAFSPDGKWLAFSSNNSGSYQIYLMEHRPPQECMDLNPQIPQEKSPNPTAN
jgi:Tol biopolymer transport system component